MSENKIWTKKHYHQVEFHQTRLEGAMWGTTVSEGFFLTGLAIFFRQEIVNQKYETHPVKSYFAKQLLLLL